MNLWWPTLLSKYIVARENVFACKQIMKYNVYGFMAMLKFYLERRVYFEPR
jgi:hypothetical protein